MNIKEVDHNFKYQLRPRLAVNRIVIHHAVSDGDISAAAIHQWHLERGWYGIGYHYVIRTGGSIERGRPEDAVGAHAGPAANGDSIGICLAGNLSLYEPAIEQLNALVWLIKDIRKRLGNLEIAGHYEVAATDCPGKKFPWAKLNKLLSEDEGAKDAKLAVNGRLTKAVVRIVDGRSQTMVSGTWIQLRDLAELLMADIKWDSGARTVNLIIK
ncbi:MAG: N-acetylmuramoyl-L-alanine amidase [Bacillota bacterium]